MSKQKSAKLVSAIPANEPDQHLKKNVGAIHTTGSLTLLQRKLVNVLLFNAYENLLNRRTHKIPLKILCAMLGWDASNDIQTLKDALRALASTTVEFNLTEEGKETWCVMSMISFGEICGGMCTYRYDEDLAERLFDPAVYAMINLKIQRNFDAGQALNLYENCVRFKNVGSTGWWTLDFMRHVTGAESSYYDDFRRLNDRVIKPCIKHINDISDITIASELKREQRRVVSVRFDIRSKSQYKLSNQIDNLQSLPFPESADDYADLKKLPVFASLKQHGISERLAIAWIRDEGINRIEEIISYVESQDEQKKVKDSTAGYIRKLIENDAEVKISSYQSQQEIKAKAQTDQKKAEARHARLEELKSDFQRMTTAAAIKSLTDEQRLAHIQNYITGQVEGYATTYNAETGKFKDKIEQLKFDVWLRQLMTTEFDEKAFTVWLQTQQNK
jgi:Initiator Replication protein